MILLGRLIGLYLVATSVAMLVNKRRALATLDEMARSGPWMLFSGMVATAVGLAIVLCHNVWTGGTLPIVVTLFGWAALLKGAHAAPGTAGTDGRRLQGAWLRAILLRLDGRRVGARPVDHAGRVRRLNGDDGVVRRVKAASYCSHSLTNAANRRHLRRERRDDPWRRCYASLDSQASTRSSLPPVRPEGPHHPHHGSCRNCATSCRRLARLRQPPCAPTNRFFGP